MCCKTGRLIISEEEKTRILFLHNLILEDDVATPNLFTISGRNFFGDGKWKNISTDSQQELISQVQKSAEFLNKKKGEFSTVKITASESQVANYDNEGNQRVPLKPGELSKRRAETMYKFLYDQFKNLVDSKIIDKIPIFERPFETKIGETEWKKGMKTDNPKYAEERFVTAEVSIKQPFECLVGLGIQVVYYKTPSPEFPCRGGHDCNLADFFVKLNGVNIGEVSLNNQGTGNDVVPPPLIVSPEQAKQIASKGGDKIIVSLACATGSNCHSSTPEVFITKQDSNGNNQIIWHNCAAPMSRRGDMTERTLLTLNACGEVIQKGNMSNDEMKKGDKTDLKNIPVSQVNVNKSQNWDEVIKKLESLGFKRESGNQKTNSPECSKLKTVSNNKKSDLQHCLSFKYIVPTNLKVTNEKTNKVADYISNTLYMGITVIDNKEYYKFSFQNNKYKSFKTINGKYFYNDENAYDSYLFDNILKLPITFTLSNNLGYK